MPAISPPVHPSLLSDGDSDRHSDSARVMADANGGEGFLAAAAAANKVCVNANQIPFVLWGSAGKV